MNEQQIRPRRDLADISRELYSAQHHYGEILAIAARWRAYQPPRPFVFYDGSVHDFNVPDPLPHNIQAALNDAGERVASLRREWLELLRENYSFTGPRREVADPDPRPDVEVHERPIQPKPPEQR